MRLLTETELELMHILWVLGGATVIEVQENLADDRDLAYTSVSTILRILEKKKFVKSHKDGRRHIYIPSIDKSEYERFSLQTLLYQVFTDTPTHLIRTLVDTRDLSSAELLSLQELIAKKLDEK
ncbi:MAG: BlaI/MecI/CopY family transcriptional regulator [Oligoflexales bacterium]|nr:BlaI/MecI/CopY family transcriptional regulator [Oligoflexales bacterium]